MHKALLACSTVGPCWGALKTRWGPLQGPNGIPASQHVQWQLLLSTSHVLARAGQAKHTLCQRRKQRPMRYVLKYLILLMRLNMASSFIQSPSEVKVDCSPFLMCITPVAEMVKYSGSASSRVVTSKSYGLNRTPAGALHPAWQRLSDHMHAGGTLW